MTVKESFDGGYLGTKGVENSYEVLLPAEIHPEKQDASLSGETPRPETGWRFGASAPLICKFIETSFTCEFDKLYLLQAARL
jgi:hypothetical protein